MNIRSLASILLFTTAFLSSCDFNEDFCVRDGMFYATCDYSKIDNNLIVEPTNQHMIAFGKSNKTQPVSDVVDFVTDTLVWNAPQGDYEFFFFAGEPAYNMSEKDNLNNVHASIDTEEVDGKKYYAHPLPLISYSIFNERLEYQKPLYKTVEMKPLTQQVIFRLHLKGDQLEVVHGLKSELDGISTGKKFLSGQKDEESVTVRIDNEGYDMDDTDNTLWIGSMNMFGVNGNVPNIFRISTVTSNNSDEFFELDLSRYLVGINHYKIIINLDFIVGKRLELNSPIIIEDWETGAQENVEITPVSPTNLKE